MDINYLPIVYWVLVTVMIVGIVGAVVPAIPGASLILLAIILELRCAKVLTAHRGRRLFWLRCVVYGLRSECIPQL